MRISGRCLCGDVHFSGDAEPKFQVKCYCVDCRKVSASGHAAMMGFAEADVTLAGKTREYSSKADSGANVIRAFCPNCGSGVYAKNEAAPGMIFLRASTLDNPNVFSPQLVVYASRAPNWDPVTGGLPTFAEGPPRR